ncbi:MAG: hypothetical protein VX529_00460 [Pseudomonadota bacterium]|nr:hypothetical protein [Pseudomonadota bacterium]
MRTADGLLLLAAGLLLSACTATAGGASTQLQRPPALSQVRPDPAPAAAGDTAGALPPQTLEAGACATFFWTADPAHRFVAFENETEGFARVFANGAEHGFYTPPREAPYVAGETYRRDYVDPVRGLDIRLTGRVGEPLPAGQRIERVVMRVLQPNGQTRVVPLIGHYACRTVAEG